jgi:hypothetical protein
LAVHLFPLQLQCQHCQIMLHPPLIVLGLRITEHPAPTPKVSSPETIHRSEPLANIPCEDTPLEINCRLVMQHKTV